MTTTPYLDLDLKIYTDRNGDSCFRPPSQASGTASPGRR